MMAVVDQVAEVEGAEGEAVEEQPAGLMAVAPADWTVVAWAHSVTTNCSNLSVHPSSEHQRRDDYWHLQPALLRSR